MPVDPRHVEHQVLGLIGGGKGKLLRGDYRFANLPWGSYEKVHVEEGNHVLDHIQLFAPSFRNEMEKMKYPTIVVWLIGHRDLQRAWSVMFDQWIGQ